MTNICNGYFEWLFYSAFFMRYVINALETEQAFSTIMIFLGITISVFASLSLYSNYVEGKVIPVSKEIVYKKLNLLLYEKSANVELACFEDNEFYDTYTLALDKATENLIDTVKNIWGVIFGVIASIAAFVLMFEVDPWSVLFILFPIIGNFVFNAQKLSIFIYYFRAFGKASYATHCKVENTGADLYSTIKRCNKITC